MNTMPFFTPSRKFLPLRLLAVALILLATASVFAQSGVEVQRTPEKGIHPRLIQDSTGDVHLLYFRKRSSNPRAREGDLYYRQYDAASFDWGPARRVSSQSFNHADPIYRANFAIDGDGRVHVVWYQGRPSQYFYTRSDPQRSEFEPKRSMVTDNLIGVDAGADIAASGNQVAISWAAGDLTMEDERTVYTRLSSDHGDTFSPEIAVGDKALGACACCSLAVEFDHQDKLLIAYRSAIDSVGRHMQLLTVDPKINKSTSGDGKSDTSYAALAELQKWDLSACPVTTNDIISDYQKNNWLIFETESRIVQMNITTGEVPSRVAEPRIRTRQKNPSIAFSSDGYKLIAWAEGVSFTRGGTLNWQLFDNLGNPVGTTDNPKIEIPDNSSPAAVVTPSGSFLILY